MPQPWKKLRLVYKKFRKIDDRAKEVIRDGFRKRFLYYGIVVRFSGVKLTRIPWEVYKMLPIRREWENLPLTATRYRYDSIDSKLEGSEDKNKARTLGLERAESAQCKTDNMKFRVAQPKDFKNKDTSSEECKPADIRPNDSKLEDCIAENLTLYPIPVGPESEDISCNNSKPNDSRVIRLLKLSRWYPGKGIHAELIQAHLDNLPDYEAISYTWGDTTKTQLVTLGGLPFAVTSNVYNILEGRCSINGPRLIWIDSICINQDDLQEKSRQVRLMREIYRGAQQVTVCLGDSPDAHLALYLVMKISWLKDGWKWPEERIYNLYSRGGTRRTPPWLSLGKLIIIPTGIVFGSSRNLLQQLK